MFVSNGKHMPRECKTLEGAIVYEYHKICDCNECKTRSMLTREPKNKVTAYITDLKYDEKVQEFFKKWKCKDGTKFLGAEYIHL